MSNTLLILRGAQARKAIAQLNLAKGQREITLSESFPRWQTWLKSFASPFTAAKHSTYVKSFIETAGDIPVSEVDESAVKAWVNSGGKRGTRGVRLSAIRSLFKFLSARDLLIGPDPSRLVRVDYSTLTHVEKESHPKEIFYDHEFKQLLEYMEGNILKLTERSMLLTVNSKTASGRDILHKCAGEINRMEFWRRASIISRCTGLRFGDICQLEWACFGSEFTVWTDKTNKRVTPVIWNRELWNKTFGTVAPAGQFVFPVECAIYRNVRFSHLLPMHFARICKKAGLPKHSFHGLRHTYATECWRQGLEAPHIARSLGHSSERTTQIYLH